MYPPCDTCPADFLNERHCWSKSGARLVKETAGVGFIRVLQRGLREYRGIQGVKVLRLRVLQKGLCVYIYIYMGSILGVI